MSEELGEAFAAMADEADGEAGFLPEMPELDGPPAGDAPAGDGPPAEEAEPNPFFDEEADSDAEAEAEPETDPEPEQDTDPDLLDAMLEAAVQYGIPLAQARDLAEKGSLDLTLSILHQQYQGFEEQTAPAQPDPDGISDDELAALSEFDPELSAVVTKMAKQLNSLRDQSRQQQEYALQQQQSSLMNEVNGVLDGLSEYKDILGGSDGLSSKQQMNRARVLDAMGDIQSRARARGQMLPLPELARRAMLVEYGDKLESSSEQKLAERMRQGKRLVSRRPTQSGRTDNDKPLTEKEWEQQAAAGLRALGLR